MSDAQEARDDRNRSAERDMQGDPRLGPTSAMMTSAEMSSNQNKRRGRGQFVSQLTG